MSTPPAPGSFGLAAVSGYLGPIIGTGQALYGSPSRYGHAFLVLDGGQVLEAQPGGARITPLARYLARADVDEHDVAFTDAPVREHTTTHPHIDPAALRARLCLKARQLEGTPYSFLDYASLALNRWHIRPDWVQRYIASTGHMICSGLVDAAYQLVGIHLFTDGRIPGDVIPGDLDTWRIQHPRMSEPTGSLCG